MRNEFGIGIKGKIWNIRYEDESEERRLVACNGFTDWTDRSIHIKKIPTDTELKYPSIYLDKILRHEIVHAYMFESGLGDAWVHDVAGHDEMTVDWIAYHLADMTQTCLDAAIRLKRIVLGGMA